MHLTGIEGIRAEPPANAGTADTGIHLGPAGPIRWSCPSLPLVHRGILSPACLVSLRPSRSRNRGDPVDSQRASPWDQPFIRDSWHLGVCGINTRRTGRPRLLLCGDAHGVSTDLGRLGASGHDRISRLCRIFGCLAFALHSDCSRACILVSALVCEGW